MKVYVETEKHNAFQALEMDGSKVMLKWWRETIRKTRGQMGGITKIQLKEQDEKAWTGLVWLTKRNQRPAIVNTSKNLSVP
jgi:hypothetical protein